MKNATVATFFLAGALAVRAQTPFSGRVALSRDSSTLASQVHDLNDLNGKDKHWTALSLASYFINITHWKSFFAAKQVFVCWSSGHTGTESLAAIFRADAKSYSVNELYVGGMGNALPILKRSYHSQNGTMLWEQLERDFLPTLEAGARGKENIFLFGHNCIFGILPALLQLAPVKVIRLRRDPCEVITSFLSNPPICPEYEKDERGNCVQFCPGDAGTLWKSPTLKTLWNDNGPKYGQQKVARCWWYLDEVEYQWQQLLRVFSHMKVLEVYWGSTTATSTFQQMVEQIASFSGVSIPTKLTHINHHVTNNVRKDESSSNPEAVEVLRKKYLNELDVALPPHVARHSVAQAACNGTMYAAYPLKFLGSKTMTQENNTMASGPDAPVNKTNIANMSLTTTSIELCQLPSCDYVLQSRLYSERCGTNSEGWPLLITGTPRSATVYATNVLKSHGMKIHNDWGAPEQHGSVAWLFAFEDNKNFGPARTGGKKFRHIFHQVKEPLGSIASMCTEPIYNAESSFLQRHVYLPSLHEQPQCQSRAALEFWVEWHMYLKEMRFPTYQIETVKPQSIFAMAGLENVYRDQSAGTVPTSTNARKHRPAFTWQELYTIDPKNAARAWILAHEFGYSYPDVDFDALTCLPYVPDCRAGNTSTAQRKCAPWTHPYPREKINRVPAKRDVNGNEGWVDAGCVEYKMKNGTFVGLTGLSGHIGSDLVEELIANKNDLEMNHDSEMTDIGENMQSKAATTLDASIYSGLQAFGLPLVLLLTSFSALGASLLIYRRRHGYFKLQSDDREIVP